MKFIATESSPFLVSSSSLRPQHIFRYFENISLRTEEIVGLTENSNIAKGRLIQINKPQKKDIRRSSKK
jgi:hypothetical protein